MKQRAWHIFRWDNMSKQSGSREHVDTVFFDEDMDAQAVYTSLRDHDGYTNFEIEANYDVTAETPNHIHYESGREVYTPLAEHFDGKSEFIETR